MIETVAISGFALLLFLAAGYDLVRMIIPNWISLALAGLFLAVAPFSGMSVAELGLHLAVAAGALVLMLALFAMRFVGGGDAKLLSAIALWMGPSTILAFLLSASLFGGALAVVLLVFRQVPIPQAASGIGWVSRLHDTGTGVPYGIALALGALWILPHTAFLHSLS